MAQVLACQELILPSRNKRKKAKLAAKQKLEAGDAVRRTLSRTVLDEELCRSLVLDVAKAAPLILQREAEIEFAHVLVLAQLFACTVQDDAAASMM